MSAADETERGGEPLFADDDWKAQAQREKEELEAKAQEEGDSAEIPPASFMGLLQELSMRVLLCLGQVADPQTGQGLIDLPSAKYTIDTLAMLEEKTKGNLTPEEAEQLGELLQNFRLAYVQVAQSVAAQTGGVPPMGAGDADGGEAAAGEGDGPKIII